jgi:hypothetical protein
LGDELAVIVPWFLQLRCTQKLTTMENEDLLVAYYLKGGGHQAGQNPSNAHWLLAA